MSDTPNTHWAHQAGPGGPAGPDTPAVPTVDARAVLRDHTPLWHAGFERGDDPALCDWCRCTWRGNAETGGCTSRLLALGNSALRERAERAAADRDGYRDTLRDTLVLVDERTAQLNARVLERVAATERAERLAGLLGAALEGLEALPDDPRDPAIRTLLRGLRAALADGGDAR